MKPKKLARNQIQNTVRTAIKQARDYVETEVAEDRIKAMRYMKGEVDIGAPKGRSTVVATKCRDAVRAAKPYVLRIFTQTPKPVEFVPATPEDVEGAKQATQYAQARFNECGGYSLLADAFDDAFVSKTGILKVYRDEEEHVKISDFSGLTEEQFALLVKDDDVEVIEYEEAEDKTEYGSIVSYSGKISRKTARGKTRIDAVPPEEFFIDADSRGIHDFYVCGHSTEKRVGDLVAMGFKFEEVIELAGDDDDATMREAERLERNEYTDDDQDGSTDPSMRPILVTEAYMRMDIEGTGVPALYRFLCAGNEFKILDREEAEEAPFSIFEVDPEPHTFFGRSLVDLITNDQDAATMLLRGLLDNIAMTNTPTRLVIENQANIQDVLNHEIGNIIRAKRPDAVIDLAIPFAAGATLPAIQYFDETINAKTGINAASMGMDPDALQSTTAAGVNAAVQAAAGQMEVIARNLAEGMRQTFRLILKISRRHADQEEMIRLDGKFVPVDPRHWNAEMDVGINVGLGTGARDERIMAMTENIDRMMAIYQYGGPNNGLVTMTGLRNAIADKNKLLGIHDSDSYWEPMDRQREEMLKQQAAAQAQQQEDPTAGLIQVESMKVQQREQSDQRKAQIEAQKAMARAQLDREAMMREDDRARDRDAQDLALKAADIQGKHGVAVDIARIKAEQAAPRE